MFSPDGKVLAGRDWENNVLLWSAPTWEEIAAQERNPF
jgi:hypothetical protein